MLRLTRVQPQHRRFELAVYQQFDNRFAAFECLIDRRLLILARRVQYEVGDVLLELQRARMTDADAQAPELRGREPPRFVSAEFCSKAPAQRPPAPID